VAALSLLAAACGDDSDDDAQAGGDGCDAGDELETSSDEVRFVPDEYDTIQAAEEAAEPGDLVLVCPGVYQEAVTVTTDDIVIRGLDRNEVILDGEFERDNGIRVIGAKGVAVENLTARNYTSNGFFWTDEADQYRGSYLTAHNNGAYGIYAFNSETGLFDNSYSSGAADGGFYIGQCEACDAVIDNVVAQHNGLGYSGTNSSGVTIVNSTFNDNRTGAVPNSGTYEEFYPQGGETVEEGNGVTMVGNRVYSNGDAETAAIDAARLATGTGILVAGGNNNVIERNLVYEHSLVGIGVIPIDDDEIEGGLFWPIGNVVRDNVVEDSELADVALADENEDAANCFEGNTFESSAPVDVETVAPCEGEPGGDRDDEPLDLAYLISRETPESGDYKDQPVPDAQENMPDATSGEWEAGGDPPEIDLAAIEVPTRED
jgi:hypothetical protein